VDYRIRRNKAELDSTGYIEIVPGKYSGKHWQEGSLFIWEDAFGMAEGILAKHVAEYDHLAMNDIPKTVGARVTAEWRDVARRLPTMTADQAGDALNLHTSFREILEDELMAHRHDMAGMLESLADNCDAFYQRGEWVCILGV
jgi:hypothetical protein